jgi:cytochrome c oxidase subunit 2
LHVPVSKVIRLELESEDVIHDFFVPDLRLKQDIIPGRTISAWFEATKPGTYEIACSQLCGPAHFGMRGELVVQTEADYEAWLKQERAAARTKAARSTWPDQPGRG